MNASNPISGYVGLLLSLALLIITKQIHIHIHIILAICALLHPTQTYEQLVFLLHQDCSAVKAMTARVGSLSTFSGIPKKGEVNHPWYTGQAVRRAPCGPPERASLPCASLSTNLRETITTSTSNMLPRLQHALTLLSPRHTCHLQAILPGHPQHDLWSSRRGTCTCTCTWAHPSDLTPARTDRRSLRSTTFRLDGACELVGCGRTGYRERQGGGTIE